MKGTVNYGVVAHNLGLVLRNRGLVTESRKFLDISLQASTESYGPENVSTLLSRNKRTDLEASLRTCAHCGPVADEVEMKVCQGCKAARYCGPACAKLHWKAHKNECRRIKAENEQIAARRADGAGPSNV